MGAAHGLAFGRGAALGIAPTPLPVRAEPVEAHSFLKERKALRQAQGERGEISCSPPQEIQSQRFKPVLMLNHRPMPTAREDVQLRIGDDAHRQQRTI